MKQRKRIWKRIWACILTIVLITGNVSVYGAETEPGIGSETEIRTEPETKPEMETEAEPESGTELGSGTEAAPGSEAETEPEAGTEKESESETGIEDGSEAGMEPGTETGTGTKTEPETESETREEPESESGSESNSGSESESDSGLEGESGSELESELESESESELESESETEQDWTEVLAYCTCGSDSTKPWEHDLYCDAYYEAMRTLCDCGCDLEDPREHMESCAFYMAWIQWKEALRQLDEIGFYAMTETPSGSPVTQTSGWTKVTSGLKFSPGYFPVKFYPGISSVEAFNSSGSVVVGKTDSGKTYVYPKTTGQGGKFGFLYRKVLYYQHKWYDLRMTISHYTARVNCDGSKTAESYPFLVAENTSMGWRFNQAMGGLVLKCEFYETGTNTRAAVNTRFQWWDVDGGQRFGIRVADGSIAGRYYYEGSGVYCQQNQTVAGLGQMELLIGQGDDTPSEDPKYCVACELKNCSTYYMSIGERDHMDSDDYTYAQSHIEELNQQFAKAEAGTADRHEYLKQTDTTLSVIDTPEPIKSISADGKSWGQQITLASPTSIYWYQVNQFVPWQDSSGYYNSFVIQDELMPGVVRQGNISVIREEDGADVTGSFVVSQTGQKITVSAKSAVLSGGGFYGYHYQVIFQAGLDLTKLNPTYAQNKALYQAENQASCIYRHSSESSFTTKWSNTVTAKTELTRVEQRNPVKGFAQAETAAEKIIRMKEETIVFTIIQEVPENAQAFWPSEIELSDTLEDCLQMQSASVEIQKKGGSYEKASDWTIQTGGQNISVKRSFSQELNGGKIKFLLTCKIRPYADLSRWRKQTADGAFWYQIPNQASVTFRWLKGTPEQVTKNTNTVTVRLRENHIRLTKEIRQEDIVWAHGNPTFTFRVEGTDLNGADHVWYEVLEFKKSAEQGEIRSLTADFIVPAGSYLAAEEKTARYGLESIHSVENGAAGENTVLFQLENGGDGAAVFRNKKVTDEGESHTSFVRNLIG